MKIDIVFPESVKKYIELQCNNSLFKYTELPELKNIKDELSVIAPNNVLEIGSGIGRASVYLFKYFGWNDTNFYLLDGNSGDKQVNGINYESKDSFYNSIDATKEFCLANGMDNLYLLDAEKEDWKSVDVKFDLCYSFLAIGFHWPMNIYLDEIYNMLADNALLIFGIRPATKQFDEFMDVQIKDIDTNRYDIVKIKREPRGERSSVAILRKI
jgi:SAM-dependent methyltransferase